MNRAFATPQPCPLTLNLRKEFIPSISIQNSLNTIVIVGVAVLIPFASPEVEVI